MIIKILSLNQTRIYFKPLEINFKTNSWKRWRPSNCPNSYFSTALAPLFKKIKNISLKAKIYIFASRRILNLLNPNSQKYGCGNVQMFRCPSTYLNFFSGLPQFHLTMSNKTKKWGVKFYLDPFHLSLFSPLFYTQQISFEGWKRHHEKKWFSREC